MDQVLSVGFARVTDCVHAFRAQDLNDRVWMVSAGCGTHDPVSVRGSGEYPCKRAMWITEKERERGFLVWKTRPNLSQR